MNEKVWKKIFENYIKAYKSIDFLCCEGIIEEDGRSLLEEKLLKSIIVTFMSEVEE